MENFDFQYIISFLKDFSYPLIDCMNHEEVCDVFHISNRCFLVSWALKLLGEPYVEILEDKENDEELVGKLIYEHGFCLESEKYGFLSGGLSVEGQLEILQRMFKFINIIKKCSTGEIQEPITLDNIQNLINTDLNIFPELGEMKTLSEEEKLRKIDELEKQIENLKKSTEISRCETKEDPCLVNQKELQEPVKNLSENFAPEFGKIRTLLEEEKFLKIDELEKEIEKLKKSIAISSCEIKEDSCLVNQEELQEPVKNVSQNFDTEVGKIKIFLEEEKLLKIDELEKEIEILKKSTETSSCETQEDSCLVNQKELQEAVKNISENFHPEFGKIKTHLEEKKLVKIDELEKEIEVLKKSTEISSSDSEQYSYQVNHKELQEAVKKLSENFYQFDQFVRGIMKEKGCEESKCYNIDPKIENVLVNCNKYLKTVSQYIADLNTIRGFVVEDFALPIEDVCSDDVSPLMVELAQQMRNVMSRSTYE